MTANEGHARVRASARNNAELCDCVCRAHGIAGEFAADAWTSARRTPQYYPDAVTLDPDVDAPALLARIDRSSGASIKDSFATLDLAPYGFRVLFDAEWIHRAPDAEMDAVGVTNVRQWSQVTKADALTEWELAWSGDAPTLNLFRPGLLAEPDVVILRGDAGGAIVAGAIANRSEQAVGISNLFIRSGAPEGAWTGCVAELSARFPGYPLVGYERDEMRAAAQRVGFRPMGPLRIWIDEG